ncbi:MAG: HEAT repeat domain-containing protein [Phycisphaerae bacterium]|nr:HEAT repeat domain-containing protein [Phycisphaerae bacterium]
MAKQQTPSNELAAILEDIPAVDSGAAGRVGKKLISGGPVMIEEIIGLIGQKFGDPAGAMPKYAMHGAALCAGRQGAKERKMVAEALSRELAKDHSPELKAFIIRQLQFCGRSEEAPVLAKFLGDQRLCEPATQALLAIGGGAVAAVLRGALSDAKGKHRVTLLNAVGRLRDKGSAPAARKLARDKDRDVRLAALYALGNIGDAGSKSVLLEAAGGDAGYERTQAVDACFLLARRLGEQGDTANAAKICRTLSVARKAPADVYDRCAALAVLAETCGADAVDDVMAAMDSEEVKVRYPAARIAVKLSGAIGKGHSAQAAKLLKKAVKATKDRAVIQDAESLLAGLGK